MADRSLSVQFLRLDHKRHRGSAMLLFGSHRLGETSSRSVREQRDPWRGGCGERHGLLTIASGELGPLGNSHMTKPP